MAGADRHGSRVLMLGNAMMLPEESRQPSAERSPLAPECSVRVISDYESFLALEPVWNTLAEKAHTTHPFLRHEWVRTWWECFGEGNDLHILVVSAGEEIIAIAPLMLSRGRMLGVKVGWLEFIQNVHTPRFDFIIARWPEAAYRAIWRAVTMPRGLWDVLVLKQLPAGSPTVTEIMRLAAEDGFRAGLWRSTDSPYVPFRGGWEHYVTGLSRNHREKVRKGLNRLNRRGRVQLEVVSSGEQLAAALDDGLRIEAAAWKGKTRTAISSRPDVESFYRTFAERAAQLGSLRLLFLTVEGVRIAFAYAVCYEDRLYVLKAGYDPNYARYSPYNLLCYLVFRAGFDSDLAEYEFLGSNEAWKLAWTKETRPHVWLFVFPPRLRARLLYYVKFRVVPTLRRQWLYLLLRGAVVGQNPRTGRVVSTREAVRSGHAEDPA